MVYSVETAAPNCAKSVTWSIITRHFAVFKVGSSLTMLALFHMVFTCSWCKCCLYVHVCYIWSSTTHAATCCDWY